MINKDGWEKKKLGDVCTTTSGGTPNRSNNSYYNGTIPWIKSGELDKGLILDSEEKITEEALKNSSAKVFPKGTLLIALYGATIGKLAFLGIDACTNQAICGIFKSDKIDSDFLYYFLLFKKPSLINKGIGGGQPNISQGIIKDLIIPIPPLTTQHQIVSELDTLSEIITKKKQQLADLDKLAQATFYDMFGDPVKNENGWKVLKIEDVCTKITDGEHITPQRESEGIYLLSARNILNHSLKLIDVDFIGQGEYDRISKRIQPKKGDILISCSGSVGRICRVPANIKFQLVRSVAILQLQNIISTIFLEYQLCTDYVQDQIKRSINQSSQANLFQGKIKTLTIIFPPILIQNQFSEKIKVLEKQKELINKSIEDIQQLFDYTMNRYFN